MIFLFTSHNAHAAKFKCWRNSQGVKECGTYVPPEYSQKKVETRSGSGRVVEVENRAKTKEEIAREKELDKQKKEQERLAAEQAKKDQVLLKTFTSTNDINMLRDSKINVIEGRIGITNANNKALAKQLEKLRQNAANIERRGKQPPEALVADIKEMERRIKNNEQLIVKKRAEQDAIKKEYAGYMERYVELKGKKKK